jgi:hypothetical protein
MGREPQALQQAVVEITPQPSDAERRAILQALEHALAPEGDGASGAWWAAGLPGGGDDAGGES